MSNTGNRYAYVPDRVSSLVIKKSDAITREEFLFNKDHFIPLHKGLIDAKERIEKGVRLEH